MTVEVDEDDLKEIKDKYDDISKFFLNNFVSFNAAVLCIQSILNEVKKAENDLKEE